MGTQKVTSEYRKSKWAQVIQARFESGQSVKDFCLTNGISRNAYFYWQKRLREEACTDLAGAEETRNIVPSGWMQLTPKQAQPVKETLNIEINGCNVTVNVETDFELLKKVCRVLMSL